MQPVKRIFSAPAWFTKGFPTIPLDGELWIGRGRYEDVSSIVRRKEPHEGWRTIRLMVFDLPEHGGTFNQRVKAMKRLVTEADSPHLAIIEQFIVTNEEAASTSSCRRPNSRDSGSVLEPPLPLRPFPPPTRNNGSPCLAPAFPQEPLKPVSQGELPHFRLRSPRIALRRLLWYYFSVQPIRPFKILFPIPILASVFLSFLDKNILVLNFKLRTGLVEGLRLLGRPPPKRKNSGDGDPVE